MEEVRSLFWIPALRKQTNYVIQNCWALGLLPRDKTEQVLPCEIVGTDYAAPLYYKSKGKKDLKAYILYLIFSCSVSRAIHLELVSNLGTTTFAESFKRLISRRGKRNIIHSDNAKIFKAGSLMIEQYQQR